MIVPADPADPPKAAGVEAFARARLAGYKSPRETVVVAELPRNASGKVLETELREKYSSPSSQA